MSDKHPLPPEAYQFGSQPQKIYEVQIAFWRYLSIFLLAAFGLVSLLLIATALTNLIADGVYSLRENWLSLCMCTSAAIAPLGIGAYLGLRSFYARKQRILVYPDAFFYSTDGETYRTIRWDSIKTVWYEIRVVKRRGIVYSRNYRYTIALLSGDELCFAQPIKDVQDFGDDLMQRVSVLLLPKMLEDFERGLPISFGAISVDKQGITLNDKFIKWEEVQAINRKDNNIVIRKAGRLLNWGSFWGPKTPNLSLFLALTKSMIGKENVN